MPQADNQEQYNAYNKFNFKTNSVRHKLADKGQEHSKFNFKTKAISHKLTSKAQEDT